MFCGGRYHAIGKVVGLSYELDYAIFFLVVDIIVEISAFHRNIHVPWILSVRGGDITFRGRGVNVLWW